MHRPRLSAALLPGLAPGLAAVLLAPLLGGCAMGGAATEAASPRAELAATAPAAPVAQGAPEPPAPPPPPPADVPAAAMRAKLGPEEAKAGNARPPGPVADKRELVVYTATLTMAVYQVDQGLGAVEKVAAERGGYLGQKRDRAITVRVPRSRFRETLAEIDKLGDVLHREISAEDVTDEHVDLEIRIKNARAMQQRLTELLAKAAVKDALEIEKELHRVTQELELLEGKLKVLADKVAYSTITVAFEPRGTNLPTARVKLPFSWLGSLNLPSLLSLTEEKR